MKILFVCTDNYTRSVIAEYCMKDYLKGRNNTSVNVASAGIRATSDISNYSNAHFGIMHEMGIDTTGFTRTQFKESFFEEYDVIIGMSELHKEHLRQSYNKNILLFNEVLNGGTTPVNIGHPNSPTFLEDMKQLIIFFREAIPIVLQKINMNISK
ncbi:arsenate-mycothiol transferase ArsC [Paenibacillus gansuensis]|uniref:Low molecular weight phosphatase family protein n=1 Tax=Paenibacillus gansuensis TaxID=306542 RepID=A0ABW5P8V6_9BACL